MIGKKDQKETKKTDLKEMTDTSNRHILRIKDVTMTKTIIHPPHGSFLMFVIGTSRDVNK